MVDAALARHQISSWPKWRFVKFSYSLDAAPGATQMTSDLNPIDVLSGGDLRPRWHIGTAGWIWIFLAIATIAMGAGFALIPNIAERIQL